MGFLFLSNCFLSGLRFLLLNWPEQKGWGPVISWTSFWRDRGRGALCFACLEGHGLMEGHPGSPGRALRPEHRGHCPCVYQVLLPRVPVWAAQPVLGTEVGSHPLPASSGTVGSPLGLPWAEGATLPALGPEKRSIQNAGYSFRQQSQCRPSPEA